MASKGLEKNDVTSTINKKVIKTHGKSKNVMILQPCDLIRIYFKCLLPVL